MSTSTVNAQSDSAPVTREPAPVARCTLNFLGDWGQANFHRILSWLCQEFVDRSPGSRIAIWNGRGGTDAVLAVARGEMDLAIATPARFAAMALDGRGPFKGQRFPGLRALAVLPQRDRLVFAMDQRFGITTFEQLRARKPALQIAVSTDDGVNNIGFATQRVMEASGVDRRTLDTWGGAYWEADRPEVCLDAARKGLTDAVIQEAIMSPWWRELLSARPMHLISFEQDALRQVAEAYGWSSSLVERHFLPGLDHDVTALDFSDFIVLVNERMPEETAYLLSWCLCERRSGLESLYRHIPPERSPLSYPLEPQKMARASVPLHPGAERFYREAGILGE